MLIENCESFPAMKALDVLSKYPVISYSGKIIDCRKVEFAKKKTRYLITIAHPGGEVPINFKMQIWYAYLPKLFLKNLKTSPWVTITGKFCYDDILNQFSLRPVHGIPFFIPRDFEKYYKE